MRCFSRWLGRKWQARLAQRPRLCWCWSNSCSALKQLIQKAAVLSSLTLVEHGACEGLEAVESSQENVRLYRADLTSPAHLAALIALETWSTVVSLPSEEDTMIKRSLALVKGALSPSEGKARPSSLWFVSAGALPVDKESMSSEASARQSWVSGFVKTLGIEHVELGVRHVDVGGGDDGVVDGVCRLLDGSMSLPEKEAEVAVRGSRLYVPRLVGSKASISAPGSMGVVPAATYVITGGLGALGLVFAERLIEEGAENVVLLSRSGTSGAAAEAAVEKLRGSKARVEVLKCDVSERESVRKMLKTVGKTLPPVRGVIHSAGVLDDATVENQTVEKFERVFSSKVDGAWHLHAAAEELGLPLDFFVLFSSISSLMGSPGQSNYASANAALDGLAHYRRGRGLPALSVQWGPWASAGMATEKDTVKRLEGQGISGITNEVGVSALSSLMSQEGGIGLAAVLPVSWSKFAARSGGRLPPFFSRVARSDVSAGGASSGAMGAAELLRSIPAAGRLRVPAQPGAGDSQGGVGQRGVGRRRAVDGVGAGLAGSGGAAEHAVVSTERDAAVATLFLDYPTVNGVAAYLLEEIMPSQGGRGGIQRVFLSEGASSEGLAVVGMACRLPGGSDSPAAFWEMLSEGRDGIVEVPASRWDVDEVYDSEPRRGEQMLRATRGLHQRRGAVRRCLLRASLPG